MIIGRVGLGATAKVAAAGAVVMVLLATAVAAALYAAGGSLGVVGDIDRIARRLFNARSFHLTAAMFIGGAAGVAVVAGLAEVMLALVGATIYNRIADLTGGLQARLPAATPRKAPAGRRYPGGRRATPAPAPTAGAHSEGVAGLT